MMGQAFPDTISRTAAVVAPGLMVLAIILFMGKVSGAHLNPAVSIAFSLRRDFPGGAFLATSSPSSAGAALAAWFLQAVVNVSAKFGSNYPAHGLHRRDAFLMEAVLTFGLVSVILGTASGAQNLGVIGALGVGAYIVLAGPVGEPDLGRIDEPGPHLRSRPGRGRLHGLLGVRRGAVDGCGARGRYRVRSSRVWRGPQRVRSGPGWVGDRGPSARKGLRATRGRNAETVVLRLFKASHGVGRDRGLRHGSRTGGPACPV